MLKRGDVVKILYGGYSGLLGVVCGEKNLDSAGLVYGVHVPEKNIDMAYYKESELEFLHSPVPNSEKKPDGTEYQRKIEDLMDRQRKKGLTKYGVTLEDNTTLTSEQRVEHLEEELIDGLMYCEHLKTVLAEPGISADDYQRAALRTAQIDKYSKDELLLNGVMGLCGEAGEVIDLVKKWKFQGHELDKEKVLQELGDNFWYGSLIAYALGYKLSDIFEVNIEKLKKRYPEGFSKERSVHREE